MIPFVKRYQLSFQKLEEQQPVEPGDAEFQGGFEKGVIFIPPSLPPPAEGRS
jgi:hypothetical protein